MHCEALRDWTHCSVSVWHTADFRKWQWESAVQFKTVIENYTRCRNNDMFMRLRSVYHAQIKAIGI